MKSIACEMPNVLQAQANMGQSAVRQSAAGAPAAPRTLSKELLGASTVAAGGSVDGGPVGDSISGAHRAGTVLLRQALHDKRIREKGVNVLRAGTADAANAARTASSDTRLSHSDA